MKCIQNTQILCKVLDILQNMMYRILQLENIPRVKKKHNMAKNTIQHFFAQYNN